MSPSHRNGDGGASLLITACECGDTAMVEDLLRKGELQNIQQRDGRRTDLLVIATVKRYIQIIQLLLDYGAGKTDTNALIWAAQRDNVAACAVLLDGGINIDHSNTFGRTALLTACEWGRASVARLLLDRGADVNYCNLNGDTALHVACRSTKSRSPFQDLVLVVFGIHLL